MNACRVVFFFFLFVFPDETIDQLTKALAAVSLGVRVALLCFLHPSPPSISLRSFWRPALPHLALPPSPLSPQCLTPTCARSMDLQMHEEEHHRLARPSLAVRSPTAGHAPELHGYFLLQVLLVASVSLTVKLQQCCCVCVCAVVCVCVCVCVCVFLHFKGGGKWRCFRCAIFSSRDGC